MQTFLPVVDIAAIGIDVFRPAAAVLDMTRLNSQLNECVVILKSNLGLYTPNKRPNISGWAAHPACLMWKGHERQLSEFGVALAEEMYNRPLPASKAAHASSLQSRRERLKKWRTLLAEFEEREFPLDPMPLLGDEEFHSAMRALLLWKDIAGVTFRRFKHGGYPHHIAFKEFPVQKAAWRPSYYETIWELFGRPEPEWYSQFGWTEEPNPDLVFYTTDRVPYIIRRKKVKAEKPYNPLLSKKAA